MKDQNRYQAKDEHQEQILSTELVYQTFIMAII